MDENQTNDEQQQQAQEAGEATSGEGAALPADSSSGSATESSAQPALSGDATAEGQLTGIEGDAGNEPAGAIAAESALAPAIGEAGNVSGSLLSEAGVAGVTVFYGSDATANGASATAGEQGNVLTPGASAGSGADGQTREVVDTSDPSFVQVEQARLMAHLAVARSHLASLESDVVRNVMAALDAIERLVHED